MTKFYVKAGFSRLKDSDLVIRVSKVLDALTDNENFPRPNPPLNILESMLNDFSAKLAEPHRNKADTILKKQSRNELIGILKKLGLYVNQHAVNISGLVSSGFPLANFPNRKNTKTPDVPKGLILGDGPHSGALRFDFKPVKGARYYQYRYGTVLDGELIWETPVPSTSSRANIIKNLKPSLEYWIQVKAFNTAGFSDWSPVAKLIAR